MTIKIDNFHKFIMVFSLLIIALVIQLSPVGSQAQNKNNNTKLPVIMYHQVTKRNSKIGKYCVSVAQLEDDLKYISENGYTAINMSDLLNIVEKKVKKPEKPIIITFDDGFESVKEYVLPLMKKYNLCCVVSVVGSYADITLEQDDHNVNYAYLDWNEIAQLTKSKYIEIQNHSYNLHQIKEGRKGAAQCAGEDYDSYRQTLSYDLTKMQNKIMEIANYTPCTFTYPFGSYSKDSEAVLKELGFKAALTCAEVINEIDTQNTEWLYKIGRFNRSGTYSTSSFFSKFE